MQLLYHTEKYFPMQKIPNKQYFDYVAERIAAGDNVRIRLKGNSMYPLLRNNKEMVVLSPCNVNELKPMDVVLFRYRGDYVLHRIINRKGEQLLMQGDGIYASFEQCCLADVVGIVTKVIRPSGAEISTHSRRWRAISRLWRAFEPLRRFLINNMWRYYW